MHSLCVTVILLTAPEVSHWQFIGQIPRLLINISVSNEIAWKIRRIANTVPESYCFQLKAQSQRSHAGTMKQAATAPAFGIQPAMMWHIFASRGKDREKEKENTKKKTTFLE